MLCECEGTPAAAIFDSATGDFTGLGTTINLDEVDGKLSRSQMPAPLPNLWIAGTNRGTILRINTDAATGVAVGEVLEEYHTAPEGHAGSPSRTSVNLDGEVWVANRNDTTVDFLGSVTRIGILEGSIEVPPTACKPDGRATYAPPFAYNTCVDRNGDGMITTSNGLVPLPWPASTPPSVMNAEDECIVSYVGVNAWGHATYRSTKIMTYGSAGRRTTHSTCSMGRPGSFSMNSTWAPAATVG